MKNLYIFLFLFLHFSCTSPYQKEVQSVLDSSGANRSQLEEVLAYYKGKDSRKYEAACFLIANMPYHESFQEIRLDEAYRTHFLQTDSVFELLFGSMPTSEINQIKIIDKDTLLQAFGQRFDSLPKPSYEPGGFDHRTITATYLINHIEEAFKQWHTNPLLKNISFEDFKELILPYRSAQEDLSATRSQLREMFETQIGKDGFNSINIPVERYKAYINKCLWINSLSKRKDKIGVYELIVKSYEQDCFDIASWTCNVFRACGIPVAFEYTPQWKERDSNHYWCASPDSTGKMRPFTPPNNNLGEDWEYYLSPASKIYRRTFGANKNTPYFLCRTDEHIPIGLSSPLIKDVTSLYHQTTTIKLPFNEDTNNELAYLCLFNSRTQINPVAWGRIDHKNKEVVFEQVPVNTLFFPMYYDENDREKMFGSPFVLNEGKKIEFQPFICNYDSLQILHLLRKYPDKGSLQHIRTWFVGARIEAGNDLTKDFTTLYVFDKSPQPYLQDIVFNNTKKYRFYRIKASESGLLSIAHLEFIGNAEGRSDCFKPTPLPLFEDEENANKDCDFQAIHGACLNGMDKSFFLFDKNMETFAEIPEVIMDFGNPVKINRIRFAPRNANNMIVTGDHYQLSYYDSNKWKNAGTKVAEKNYLLFENIPSGTIYRLQNLDNGKEELPFFYKNGKQCW